MNEHPGRGTFGILHHENAKTHKKLRHLQAMNLDVAPNERDSYLIINGEIFMVDLQWFRAYSKSKFSFRSETPTLEVTIDEPPDRATIEMFIEFCHSKTCRVPPKANLLGLLTLSRVFQTARIEAAIYKLIEKSGNSSFVKLFDMYDGKFDSSHLLDEMSKFFPDALSKRIEDPVQYETIVHLPIRMIHNIMMRVYDKSIAIPTEQLLRFISDYISTNGSETGSLLLSFVKLESLSDEALNILSKMPIDWSSINVPFARCFLDTIFRLKESSKRDMEEMSVKHAQLESDLMEERERVMALTKEVDLLKSKNLELMEICRIHDGFVDVIGKRFVIKVKASSSYVLDHTRDNLIIYKRNEKARPSQIWTTDKNGHLIPADDPNLILYWSTKLIPFQKYPKRRAFMARNNPNVAASGLSQWVLDRTTIRSKVHRDLVLDVNACEFYNGNSVIVYPNNDGNAQQWQLELV